MRATPIIINNLYFLFKNSNFILFSKTFVLLPKKILKTATGLTDSMSNTPYVLDRHHSNTPTSINRHDYNLTFLHKEPTKRVFIFFVQLIEFTIRHVHNITCTARSVRPIRRHRLS